MNNCLKGQSRLFKIFWLVVIGCCRKELIHSRTVNKILSKLKLKTLNSKYEPDGSRVDESDSSSRVHGPLELEKHLSNFINNEKSARKSK